MSFEQAQAFVQHVQTNEPLRLELKAVENDSQQLLEIAKREGYEFSESDLLDAVRNIGYDIETALNDAELSSVTGGTGGERTISGCDSNFDTYCSCGTGKWPDC